MNYSTFFARRLFFMCFVWKNGPNRISGDRSWFVLFVLKRLAARAYIVIRLVL